MVLTVGARNHRQEMGAGLLDQLRAHAFETKFLSHSAAILQIDAPAAINELEECLLDVAIPITEIIGSGGGEAQGTQRLRRGLNSRGWPKGEFIVEKIINGLRRESTSHEVDHVRRFENGTVVALEIEWNNKDPFFDRDLENFKRLHGEGAISVGVIVTRGSMLQEQMRDLVFRFTQQYRIQSFDDLERLGLNPPTRRQRDAVNRRVNRARNAYTFAAAWTEHFVSDKFGAATTHWRKLMERVDRGVGNPCPLLLIGLPASIVTFDPAARIEPAPEDSERNQ
jgi:hypothetical protein